MTKLYLLGPAEIRNGKGELEHSFLSGPKRLALLAYLLLNNPGGFHRRDSLLPVFWPYQGQKSARNALSNMLYHIRKTLGKEAVENRGSEEIRLNPEVFWCDVLAFEAAFKENEYEKVLKLFRSELLKGFHVQDISAEFDQWLEQERKKFNSLAIKGGQKQAETAADKNNYNSAIHWAAKVAELEPFSEPAHIRLINYLNKAGDQNAALETCEKFTERIRNEFGEDPGPELKILQEKIKNKQSAVTAPAAKNASYITMASQPSIAVLPFETLGMEKASAFTDAIHGDILTRLSQVSDLFVISRTSVQSFRGTKKLLPEIGMELQVGWILTGEIQEIDQHVKVNVRLVLASEDRQVWAEIYQRELNAGEIFNIQAEITRSISQSLEMRLTHREQKAIKQVPTEDLEAFRLHAHGRWNLDKRTEEGMRLAEEFFRKAIVQDPSYAQARLGLADTLALLHDYAYEKNESGILAEAEEAAQKALELDEDLAEAYASLGLLHTTRRNGEAAVYNLKKATELRPGYAEAHIWLCWIFLLIGESSKALKSIQKGVSLNPLSQEALCNLSLAWLTIGNFEVSLHEAERLYQLQPDFTTANFLKGVALYHLGRHQEAQLLLKDLRVPWAGNGPIVTRILSLIRSGDNLQAQKLAEDIPDDNFAIGLMQAARGRKEEAFHIFAGIDQWNYWEMLSINFLYPDLLNPIRQEKNFNEILQKVDRSWDLVSNALLPGDTKEPGSKKKVLIRERDISFSNNSIAVLPFIDMDSLDPRFTDGIHGDVIISLSRIKNLQVISRASICRYDKAEKKPQEIGAELNVEWLLEGEVKQDPSQLTISIQLINAPENSVFWNNDYRRELTAENIFMLQKDITRDILKVLEVHSTKQEQRVQKTTADLEAYRLYVQGRNGLDQRTESGIYRGLDCFQGSIELDPGYALAWSGLADALSLLHYYGFSIPRNSPDPMETAMRAVQLNPDLSEAHAALGIAHSIRQEGPAALKEFEHATDLSPGYAEALIWLGWINLITGRPERALAPGLQAVRLNPLTPAVRVFLAEIYLSNGLYEEALTEAKRGREINPDYGLANYMEGLILYHSCRFEEAAGAFERTLSIIPGRGTPSIAEVKTALAFTKHALGDKKTGLQLKDDIYGRIDPFPLALLQALYGETDKAFETFARVEDWSSFSTETIRYFFPDVLSTLRKDRRYEDLLHKVNRAWRLPVNEKIDVEK